jgi:hypothetical protein
MKADIYSKSDLPLPENPNKTKEKMGKKERGFWDLAGLVQKAQTGQSKKNKEKNKKKPRCSSTKATSKNCGRSEFPASMKVQLGMFHLDPETINQSSETCCIYWSPSSPRTPRGIVFFWRSSGEDDFDDGGQNPDGTVTARDEPLFNVGDGLEGTGPPNRTWSISRS